MRRRPGVLTSELASDSSWPNPVGCHCAGSRRGQTDPERWSQSIQNGPSSLSRSNRFAYPRLFAARLLNGMNLMNLSIGSSDGTRRVSRRRCNVAWWTPASLHMGDLVDKAFPRGGIFVSVSLLTSPIAKHHSDPMKSTILPVTSSGRSRLGKWAVPDIGWKIPSDTVFAT